MVASHVKKGDTIEVCERSRSGDGCKDNKGRDCIFVDYDCVGICTPYGDVVFIKNEPSNLNPMNGGG